jgi:hypothetical protein
MALPDVTLPDGVAPAATSPTTRSSAGLVSVALRVSAATIA